MGAPLRVAIVLLGARLSVADVAQTGLGAIAVIIACMAFALGLVMTLGRFLQLPVRLALLIGVGTAVCGNSAIIATAPAIEAEERDVSVAVATITLFGTAAVLLYPLIGHVFHFGNSFFGHWAGIAVNDTSQVTATGFAYSSESGEIATIVKLTRNVMMGPLIVVIGAIYLHSGMAVQQSVVHKASRLRFLRVVPLFVLGFISMALLNSAGIIPTQLSDAMAETSRALILIALVAVGLNTDVTHLLSVGLRPLYIGLLASAALSILALILISLVIGQ
jgi:uncharacterized integral membrane protein (TIGR00698 family)